MDPKKDEQESLRSLLVDTVAFLCKRGLTYQNLKVQGLLTLTINDKDVVVVHFNEFDQKECKSHGSNTSTTSTECQQSQYPNQPRFQSSSKRSLKKPRHKTPPTPAYIKDEEKEVSDWEEDCLEASEWEKTDSGETTNNLPEASSERSAEECSSEHSKEINNNDEPLPETILIRNLTKEISDRRLKSVFEMNGIPVKQIRRQDASFCYMDLQRVSDVAEALTFDGRSIDGTRVITVYVKAEDHPPVSVAENSPVSVAENSPVSVAENSRNVYVGNLSVNADSDSLKAAFTGCTAAQIPLCRETGKPRGFGFVQFEDRESAQKALHSMPDKVLDGRRLFLQAFSSQKRWADCTAGKSVPVSGTVEDNGRQDETPQGDGEET